MIKIPDTKRFKNNPFDYDFEAISILNINNDLNEKFFEVIISVP